MKTAYITEPRLNFQWPHTSGTSDIDLAQQAYKKLFDDAPLLAENMSESGKNSDNDIYDIKEYNIFTFNDMYIANTMDPIDNELTDILTIETEPVNEGTPVATYKYIKSLSNNPTDLINKNLIVFIRPKLYQNITHDVGILVRDKKPKSIEDTLAYAHAAQAEITTGFDVGRKLAMMKRFINYDTLQNYALYNKIMHADFKDVTILYDSMSIYPYRIVFKKGTKPSMIRTTFQMIKDIIKYEDVDDILMNRFGIDRQKTLSAELALSE